jgi:hypothetical protein
MSKYAGHNTSSHSTNCDSAMLCIHDSTVGKCQQLFAYLTCLTRQPETSDAGAGMAKATRIKPPPDRIGHIMRILWLGLLKMVESGFRLFVPIVLRIRSLDKRLVSKSNEGNATARRSRMAGLSVESQKKNKDRLKPVAISLLLT